MIKVLIIGKNSYIGLNLVSILDKNNVEYKIVSSRAINYKILKNNFTHLVYLSGLVHKKYSKTEYQDFVNKTLSIAKFAKDNKVNHFINLSSMAIYGKKKNFPFSNVISTSSKKNPISLYGKYKLAIEQELSKLVSESFQISNLRPPSVYGGKNNKYDLVFKYFRIFSRMPFVILIRSLPKSSFLHVFNLSIFILKLLRSNISGDFNLRDKNNYSLEDIFHVWLYRNKKKRSFYIKKIIFKFLFPNSFKKFYGGLVYDDISSRTNIDYQFYSLENIYDEYK
jgi:nucleoside-diphosphate-sugar epimerase